DGARDPGRAAAPGHRTPAAVPVGGADHVVAVAQRHDGGAAVVWGAAAVDAEAVVQVAHLIAGVAADEAVAGVGGARDAGRAAPPVTRPRAPVPVCAAVHVVPVAQGDDADLVPRAHLIAGVAADEALAGVDGAGDPGRAAAPGRRTTAAVPVPAADYVVAVA